MTVGQRVARMYKRQYFAKGKWDRFPSWDIQPEEIHTILLELKTKEAVEALLDVSWTRALKSQHVGDKDD